MHSMRVVLALLSACVFVSVSASTTTNCLAEVIYATGSEKRQLERRGWTYEGADGVMNWGKFNNTCVAGERQSPINFEGDELAITTRPNLRWSNLMTPFNFTNNGHTVQMGLVQSTPSLVSTEPDGRQYIVQQVHFHSPSEHHVDEHYYDLEAHFVHTTPDGKLNVIGVFFEVGEKENAWIGQFVDKLPPKNNTITQVPSLDMSQIIDKLSTAEFYSYTGSLTTPPCTEGVLWMVAREPLVISLGQLKKLREVMPFNSRPVQANVASEPEAFVGKERKGTGQSTSEENVARTVEGIYKSGTSSLMGGRILSGLIASATALLLFF
ncbi:alpha carbonic anhydrase [Chytriomyces cf. hyalinus JEL632]|nr:alpha carbonic anhydrase [Chytriomyces cf. hyalinus JEL632]